MSKIPEMENKGFIKDDTLKAINELTKQLGAEAYGPYPTKGQAGVMVSLVNGKLDDLTGGATQRANVEIEDLPRKWFFWLLTGNASSKQFTQGQVTKLGEWFMDEDNTTAAKLTVIAAGNNGLIPTEMELKGMDKPQPAPVSQVVQPAVDNEPTTPPTVSVKIAKEPEPAIRHREAVLSANAKIYDSNGIDWMVTIRDGVTGEAFAEFVTNLNKAGAYLIKSGFTVKHPNTQPRPSIQPTPGAPQPVNPVEAPQPAPQGQTSAGQFDAETLVGTVSNGKAYWKVKGGPFKQWGITIWPEVLDAAGLDSSSLDPTAIYDVSGFTAYYEGEPGQGGRRKVVKMAVRTS